MRSRMLLIFVITVILPLFSTAASSTTAPDQSINCYKYEKNFTDLNIIDAPPEEKEKIKCGSHECFSYICPSENGEYTLGNGCRDDFIKSCKPKITLQNVIKGCSNPTSLSLVLDGCAQDYCNHKNLHTCISRVLKSFPGVAIGTKYFVANITYTQLTTPAPTTTTTTTPVPAAARGNQSDLQNGGSSQSGNHSAPNNSVNSEMNSFIFFGIFIFNYFM